MNNALWWASVIDQGLKGYLTGRQLRSQEATQRSEASQKKELTDAQVTEAQARAKYYGGMNQTKLDVAAGKPSKYDLVKDLSDGVYGDDPMQAIRGGVAMSSRYGMTPEEAAAAGREWAGAGTSGPSGPTVPMPKPTMPGNDGSAARPYSVGPPALSPTMPNTPMPAGQVPLAAPAMPSMPTTQATMPAAPSPATPQMPPPRPSPVFLGEPQSPLVPVNQDVQRGWQATDQSIDRLSGLLQDRRYSASAKAKWQTELDNLIARRNAMVQTDQNARNALDQRWVQLQGMAGEQGDTALQFTNAARSGRAGVDYEVPLRDRTLGLNKKEDLPGLITAVENGFPSYKGQPTANLRVWVDSAGTYGPPGMKHLADDRGHLMMTADVHPSAVANQRIATAQAQQGVAQSRQALNEENLDLLKKYRGRYMDAAIDLMSGRKALTEAETNLIRDVKTPQGLETILRLKTYNAFQPALLQSDINRNNAMVSSTGQKDAAMLEMNRQKLLADVQATLPIVTLLDKSYRNPDGTYRLIGGPGTDLHGADHKDIKDPKTKQIINRATMNGLITKMNAAILGLANLSQSQPQTPTMPNGPTVSPPTPTMPTGQVAIPGASGLTVDSAGMIYKNGTPTGHRYKR